MHKVWEGKKREGIMIGLKFWSTKLQYEQNNWESGVGLG